MYYNKRTKEYVIKISKLKFISLRIRIHSWAVPIYVSKNWFGIIKSRKDEKYKIEWNISILCFHFNVNSSGPIIQDKDYPWKS